MKIKSIVNKIIAKAKAFISSVKATWKNRKAVIKATLVKWDKQSDSVWFVPVTFIGTLLFLYVCDSLVSGITNTTLAVATFLAIVIGTIAVVTFIAWVAVLLTDSIKNTQTTTI